MARDPRAFEGPDVNDPATDDVVRYYDERTEDRLRDFLRANPRVEASVTALLDWTGGLSIESVLEVGCGVGHVTWRLGRAWPGATVVGTDISSESIALATQIFGNDGVQFVCADVRHLPDLGGPFDLIVLMDVYEHVPVADRPELLTTLRRSLQPGGHVFLSVPTPRYQAYLRAHDPGGLQPVDEDVTPTDLERLSGALSGALRQYREVDVWAHAQYAHALIEADVDVSRGVARTLPKRLRRAVSLRIPSVRGRAFPSLGRRRSLVRRRSARTTHPD